jgi:acetyl esterase/lipase
MKAPEGAGAAAGETAPRPAGMPADIARALREIGPRIAPPETAALYAPLHPAEPYEGVDVTRDVRYGGHERHVLDVFTIAAAGSSKPVVVFVHGGGFTRGAKRLEGSPFYDNVMLWAARQGFVGVNVNYRLAPEFQWPSGIEDVEAVVAWIEDNIAQHGGSAERIFLWGHSAGAAHVADYLAHRQRGGRAPKVVGAILTSGFYDLGDEVSVWEAYYGNDVAAYPKRSSLPALAVTDVPLLVVDAELDPESFRVEARKLLQRRKETGKPTRYVHLPNHSHISETYAVGTADDSLTTPVLEFVRDHS